MEPLRNILCVVETGSADSALERGVSLAENNQSQLTVAEVIPGYATDLRLPAGAPTSEALRERMRTEHLEALEAMVRPHRDRVSVTCRLLEGTSFLEIIRTVQSGEHDLVIKAAENPSYLRHLFGADDMHLLRKCPCPVWLTRPGEKTDYGCILAAVDFDPARPQEAATGLNRRILQLAASLAVSDFAELHVVHVWDAPAEDVIRRWDSGSTDTAVDYVQEERAAHAKGLDTLAAELRQWLGAESYDYLVPRFHLRRGSAATAIPELAGEIGADMVVMGTLARTGISGLIIGNTAETILQQLGCAVLAVKGPEFVSPVGRPD